jgi:polyvinyl alcohol dehydrogenase (cytochrome)
MTRPVRSAALTLLAGAALAAAPAGALADIPGCAPASAGGDWPVYGGGLDSHREQTAPTALTPASVGGLGLAWKLAMPDGGKIQSVPTEADGCVFTGTDIGTVMAINAATGKVVWSKKLDDGSGSSPFVGAGLVGAPAIANGNLYIGLTTAAASKEVALDEATGNVLWSTDIDKDQGGGADSSPVPFDVGSGPMIFQAYQGDESGPHSNPGYAILDALTGAVLVSKKMLSDADYAAGDRGGSITTTPAVDPVRKLAFTGTGNPANAHRNPVTDAQVEIDLDPSHATFGDILAKAPGSPEDYPLPQDQTPPTCHHEIQWPASIVSCLQFDMDYLSSGNLYTASNGHQYFAELQKSGVMQAVDTTTMKPVWTATLGGGCLACNLSSSATDGKSIYAATTGGNLYSLNGDTGAINWVRPVTGTFHFNGISIANGVVYNLNDAGFLEAFSAADGTPLLARSLASDDRAPGRSDAGNSAGISIARDTVFVPSTSQTGDGGTLFAYKLGAGGGSGLPGLPPLPGVPAPPGSASQVVSAAGAQNYGYATPVVLMSKGGTLSYTNLDPVKHNVVSSSAGLFRSDFAGLGKTVPVVGADKLPAGQYGFYCSLHTGMQGTLIVQ